MDKPKVRDIALGKWPAILHSFGLTERQLSGKHVPCPICAGEDRFRFDNQEGRGTYYCRCGAGDGVQLVMKLKGWDFKTAAKEVEQLAGVVQAVVATKSQDEASAVERLTRVWSEARNLQTGDAATRYLAGRGLSLDQCPDCFRLHPALPYYDENRKFVGKFTTLLARVVGPDGTGRTLHRTYLNDGRKAPVDQPKKLMSGKQISGGAIRLFPAGACLGIAEGIETALAASELFGLPVWSCVSANGIEKFEPPPGVERVVIFSDNDARKEFTGQIAAFSAAKRLRGMGLDVEVKIPDESGDWLDVLNLRRKVAA